MKEISIYTDGSCLGNPGPGGWAYIISYKDKKKEDFGSEDKTTNNRMELKAIIQSLKALKTPCKIELFSDSKLMVQAINEWLDKWIAKKFKNKANVDLWKEYIKYAKKHEIKAFHVRAHKGDSLNERCDFLANQAAKKLLNSLKKKPHPLSDKINYSFKDESLLVQALSHRSFNSSTNNERLEFLGDAVLDLAVGEYLFKSFLKSNEGELSKIRASLVSEKALAKMARQVGLGSYIKMSEAEQNNGGKDKPSILADALEAILGAIFLEAGFEIAKKSGVFILKKSFKNIDAKELLNDYKSKLQELSQMKMAKLPSYKLISMKGPDHKKEFEIAVILGDKELARGSSHTKKDAEQIAAKKAWELLNDKN